MILLVVLLIFLPFALVLLVGAPYLPTRKVKAKEALDLLDLKKGEVFVDLGSGDGAVLIEAAKRGLICYGYELNPFVWFVSKLRTLRYGRRVHIYCRNFWHKSLPDGTKGVFVFLLEKYMSRLEQKFETELKKGSRVVSYTFQLPNKKPVKESKALYFYKF